MQYAFLKFLEMLIEVTHSIRYSVLSSISSLMSLPNLLKWVKVYFYESLKSLWKSEFISLDQGFILLLSFRLTWAFSYPTSFTVFFKGTFKLQGVLSCCNKGLRQASLIVCDTWIYVSGLKSGYLSYWVNSICQLELALLQSCSSVSRGGWKALLVC